MNFNNITWTFETVEEWLQIAANVDRVMPRVGPTGYHSCTFMVIRSFFENLQAEIGEKPKFVPTSEQISIWETVMLHWINLIDSAENKKIVWLHSCGMGWVKIGKKYSLSRQTVANRYERTIKALTTELNRHDIKYS